MGATHSGAQAQPTPPGHLSDAPLSARDAPVPQTFPGRWRWWMDPALCTPNSPVMPYGTKPLPVQQVFGVKAHLQVAFHCHHFGQKKKSNSQLLRA